MGVIIINKSVTLTSLGLNLKTPASLLRPTHQFVCFEECFKLILAALGGCRFVWAFSRSRGCGYSSSQCAGFSSGRALSVVSWAAVGAACELSSRSRWAVEHKLSNFGAQASLLRDMWSLPEPGIKPVSPALAGRFLPSAPPGTS